MKQRHPPDHYGALVFTASRDTIIPEGKRKVWQIEVPVRPWRTVDGQRKPNTLQDFLNVIHRHLSQYRFSCDRDRALWYHMWSLDTFAKKRLLPRKLAEEAHDTILEAVEDGDNVHEAVVRAARGPNGQVMKGWVLFNTVW